ncbi:MAG TPA: F0F1 ATP synthase subunit epsilon [Desulfobacterales bacterium]|jgi:F-type H+-transporting ATPase subunit epsilon|nr:F0F1 ATP synthase subunit epsilon [Desulfobacterales bacterium]
MAGTIRLEVVTPEKIVVSEEAQIVMAPGVLGEFGVLIGHTPFLTALKNGAVRFNDAKGDEHSLFVSGGFAEVLPDQVTILAESAERRRDIDVERARKALERAQKRLAEARSKEEVDFTRAQAALQRAILRLRIAENRPQH